MSNAAQVNRNLSRLAQLKEGEFWAFLSVVRESLLLEIADLYGIRVSNEVELFSVLERQQRELPEVSQLIEATQPWQMALKLAAAAPDSINLSGRLPLTVDLISAVREFVEQYRQHAIEF